jgi:hypothetical protein
MGGTPNGLKQFLLQGRTTIKENVFQNCLRSYPLWEGMMDFHAWMGSKITHGCFYSMFFKKRGLVIKTIFIFISRNGLLSYTTCIKLS